MVNTHESWLMSDRVNVGFIRWNVDISHKKSIGYSEFHSDCFLKLAMSSHRTLHHYLSKKTPSSANHPTEGSSSRQNTAKSLWSEHKIFFKNTRTPLEISQNINAWLPVIHILVRSHIFRIFRAWVWCVSIVPTVKSKHNTRNRVWSLSPHSIHLFSCLRISNFIEICFMTSVPQSS